MDKSYRILVNSRGKLVPLINIICLHSRLKWQTIRERQINESKFHRYWENKSK